MNDIYLSNTLTKKKEKFVPITANEVRIYSCGPTVYWDQHIGNMYAYTQWDVLIRFFKFVGLKVKWVMNITDVGHLTGDNLGDADTGEDRMEKGAKREGVSVWDLAERYIKQFNDSRSLLNISDPDLLPRATKHISEQIKLAETIEKNGYAYKTKKGLVFDTSKFAEYSRFAGLNLDKQKQRDDVAIDPDKKNSWDFFLWVVDPKHIMNWESPWGVGYPGWHLECTAMSTKYLGNEFDIHTGGIEHIGIHHTNEIAQGFGAFGKSTANYWLHNGWLVGEKGEKVGKSTGGLATVQDLVKKGYDPLAFRYLVLSSHYKKGVNFSWQALDSAQEALKKLRSQISVFKTDSKRMTLSSEKLEKVDNYRDKFIQALANDLNAPQALAVLWEMLKSNIPSEDKYDLAISFDEVLGLKLNDYSTIKTQTPENIQALLDKREEMRKEGKWEDADKVRKEIEKLGFKVKDTSDGSVLEKIT